MKKALIIALSMVAGTLSIPALSTYADEEIPAPGVDCSIYPEDPSCLSEDVPGTEPPLCDLYPEDPSCSDPNPGEADICEINPEDPSCSDPNPGEADICEINPEYPSCLDPNPGEEPSSTDPYTENFQLSTFASAISAMLPIVGVAVLVGFLFYVIRWSIGLFRGI